MSYETKVILLAIADIIRTSKDTTEALERLARIANAEGVIIDTTTDTAGDNKARQ